MCHIICLLRQPAFYSRQCEEALQEIHQPVPNVFGFDEYEVSFVLSDNTVMYYDFQAYIYHPGNRELRRKYVAQNVFPLLL
jgi:hypothetical protein